MTRSERETIAAIVHQLNAGEASDILAYDPNLAEDGAAVKDLRWCRSQLKRLLAQALTKEANR